MRADTAASELRSALLKKLALAPGVGVFATTLLERASAKPIWAMACNAEKLIAMRQRQDLRELYGLADLWFPDGVGASIAARACGRRVNRVTGVDLGEEALQQVGVAKGRVALIGAMEPVSVAVSAKAEALGCEIALRENGYFQDEAAVIERVTSSGPDLICIAMGSPKQERLARKVRMSIRHGLIVCLGGSFDVYAGLKTRAPAAFRGTGFEWLYRLVSEPSRFRRYLALRHYPVVLKDLMLSGRH